MQLVDGWFKYEKDFEQAEKEDKRGAILTLHYENLKKVMDLMNICIERWMKNNINFEI